MQGKVERYLNDEIKKHGTIHLTLIDPEGSPKTKAVGIAREAQKSGTTAIMVGGSTSVSVYELDETVKAIKRAVKVPVTLFPNDVAGISEHADAIFFMSLLNSTNTYYITGVQALGAPLVKRYGLEAIPMAYLIAGDGGGAAGFIGRAQPIPFEKPSLAAIYALAGQYMGMRLVYLEAGSGAGRSVPAEMIKAVKASVSIPLVVGGGVKTSEAAAALAKAGADAVVTGTIGERDSSKLAQIIRSVRSAGR